MVIYKELVNKYYMLFIGASFIPLETFANTEAYIDIGVVLDGSYQDKSLIWGMRDEGFGLGHSELSFSGAIDHHFKGQLTTALANHDGKTELELEEAFIETLGLPFGLKAKAGRMLSNIGYLNSKHVHEDAFSDRPVVYRALFGSHYFDDGVNVSWLMPTDFYFQTSFEAFSGKEWNVGYQDPATIGVYTVNTQFGGDIFDNHSWRLGFSALYNANGEQFAQADEHGETHGHDHHSHEHTHTHGPIVTGEFLYGSDFTWKWAPDGNYKQQHLRFTGEYWYVAKRFDQTLTELANGDDTAQGWYAELSYQFSPSWTLSTRYGQLDALIGNVYAHGDHYHGGLEDSDIKETAVALDWHPSHFSRIRAQMTQEQQADDEDYILTLQYIMSFGAHHAHSF